MADNRKRASRGGKQAASGSRPIRRNDRAAAPKSQRDRTQAARPQRDRNRDAVQAPKGEFIEGRRAAAEALRTGFPIKRALIAEGGERDAALSRLVDDLNAAGVRIKYVPRAQLDALSSHGAHQGIALEVGNFPYADVADILDRAGDGPALVIVLDHVTDDGNFGAIVRSAEVVGAAGVIIANKRAAGLVNGSLRALARQKDTLAAPQDLATKYSHPQPLVDCLRASMDEETLEAFLAADNDIPKTALQCNPLIAAPEQVASALDEAQIPYEPHPWLPGCFLVSGTGNLETLPLFQSGAVYVQDPAAKLAALASGAAPGMRVLDCCAAPGGKSFAAAMQMENTGSILSCDLHPHKIALIEKNAARLGISILKAETRSAAEFDPALENGFDLVIADVPCSGLGVIRKKPDIRYKPLDAIERLPAIQTAILENVCRYVRPGGTLLYSTCTVRKEENEDVARTFLLAHPEFSPEPFAVPAGLDLKNEGYATLLPQKHAADGFFICKLRRHA